MVEFSTETSKSSINCWKIFPTCNGCNQFRWSVCGTICECDFKAKECWKRTIARAETLRRTKRRVSRFSSFSENRFLSHWDWNYDSGWERVRIQEQRCFRKAANNSVCCFWNNHVCRSLPISACVQCCCTRPFENEDVRSRMKSF